MLRNLPKKIWHDPVGSKVIASIITLALPSIATYATSLATKNLFLIFGAGGAALVLGGLLALHHCRSHRIILDTKSSILSTACSNGEIDHVTNFRFLGRNRSNRKPILGIAGKLQSNLTNEGFPIYFNVEGNLVALEETNGIPAGASFELIVPVAKDHDNAFIKGDNGKWNANQGIGLQEFLSNLESSTLTLEIEGRIQSHSISPSIVRQNIEAIQRRISPPAKPRITKK